MSALTKESGSHRSSTVARSVVYAFQALALIFLGACSNESQRLTDPSLPGLRFDIFPVEGTDAVVCVSNDSPAGNYTFTVSHISFASGGSTVAGPNPAIVGRGTCFTLVSRLIPKDVSNPAADPPTTITYRYTSNDVPGGANYASTTCVDDPGIPASSPCGKKVVAHVNILAGTVATFSFAQSPAAAMIAALRITLSNLDLPKGTAHNLDDRLREIQKEIDKGHNSHACKKLDHFIKEITGHAWKKIESADAATLVGKANDIKAALGC